MAFWPEKATVLSSGTLRIATYIFLRWCPATLLPTIIWTAFAIYIPSFLARFLSQSVYDVIEDDTEITITETSHSLRDQGQPAGAEEEIAVRETTILKDKPPRIWRTMLTGLPSPSSALWSLTTLVVNIVLVLAATDLVYRAKVFYPSHDLSFARLGYVSTTEAKLLVREPHPSQLPISVSYRLATHPALYEDASWQSVGTITSLGNDTDFTGVVTFPLPNYPDRTYQWATSNNHTGFFTIPPKPGHVPKTGFTFLTSSCIKARFPYNPFTQHPLSIPGFKHMADVIKSIPGGAQFMLFLGDFIYIDVPRRFGTTLEDYRREYRQVYASPDWPLVGQNLSWIHVLDDHEIEDDWDQKTTGVYRTAADPWHHYQTSVNPPKARQAGQFHRVRRDATYFEFTQGPASFFLADTRAYRDSASTMSSEGTEKSMLGAEQLDDLLAYMARPEPKGVKWKIVAFSVPFTKNWHVNGKDTWGGYLGERRKVLEAMWDVGLRGGVGVVIVSGDRHEFAATAFPPPLGGRWPVSATVHEFSSSPLNQFYLPTPSYWQTDDEDIMVKYIPKGNSKIGAVTIEDAADGQSILKFHLYVDGHETWSSVLLSPPTLPGKARAKDALWG